MKSVPRVEESITQGVLALARSIQPPSEIRLLEPAPQQLLLVAATNGHSNGTTSTVAVREEDAGIPEDEAIESLVRPLVESAEAAADAEPLIEACIEAVAMAVEVAVETVQAASVIEAPVEVVTATAAAPLPEPTYDPGPLCRAFELHAEAVLHVIHTQIEAVESGIRAIVAAFEAQPVTALLAAPREIVKAPALPATQWMRMPKPSIPSVRPCDLAVDSLSSGPLTSALAGPCLPAELRTFIEKKSAKSARPRKRVAMPAWIISLLVATSLFLGAGSLLQYFSENRDSKAGPAAGQHPLQASAGTSTGSAIDPHPFARFVEVTGLRVIADLNRKSQMQYLVVNHSSTRLSDVALKIAVRSTADSSGAAPLFTLSVVVPSLAPYQSKEIRTELDAGLRPTSLPDWDNLRADVQVSTKQ
ncbi:MAG TPA: hypothetical protein VIX89_12200 [Bryobacteraceae bacterium]